MANATYKSPTLPLLAQMPHVHIPIGSDAPGKNATLCAIINTGAGCNLGRKAYHMQIYNCCPDLVVAVKSGLTNQDWQDIPIGSIEEQGQPIVITAVIVYRTPFVVDGHAIHLCVGLADHAAINTIIGITFLRAAQAVLHLQSSRHSPDHLVCPKLGVNLPVTMQDPKCLDSPDSIQQPDRRSSVTFVASPKATPGYLVSPDTTALLSPQMQSKPAEDGDDFLMCKLD